MKAVLGLEDGTIFSGTGFGIEGEAAGEIIVSLLSTGYMEALSDPGVEGQILTFGYPLLGNYGALKEQMHSSRVHASAAVCRELCTCPKNRPAMKDFFEENGLIGIEDVDTRMLTIKLREQGVMRAAVITGSDDGEKAVALARAAPVQESRELIPAVTCKAPYHIEGRGRKIAVLDLGVRSTVLKSLANRGADLYIYPYGTTTDVILADKPQALFVTNGPGSPNAAPKAIAAVKEILGTIPVQGICMGCEIIAAALGADISKLKFGHRGASQPVKFADGTVAVTYQSHGYAVEAETLPEGCSVNCVNANDRTLEGFENADLGIYACMFHPEHDAIYDGVEKPVYDIMYRGIPNA
ncbi:MAG TPA: glutamine-hydrolyzing carbamoyl-phosphate synthase small subunit [Methanocorpusculum sp.]|nr:glutamine-hydrolyzing carbamoyl-phosphate synthase small subunit [Methanocorpusculum sp.]